MNWRANPKLLQCVAALNAGEVVAYPTEAVWGLGCDPSNAHAVEKILNLKNRVWSKGLILVAASIEQFDYLIHDCSEEQKAKLSETWPGHNTWLVEHKGRVSPWVCGQHKTVALRVSQHPIVKALCEQFGGPIVSTSANPQGLRPATSMMSARRYFSNRGVHFSPGNIGNAKSPSVIRMLSTGEKIRA